jgi:hypothetical protein
MKKIQAWLIIVNGIDLRVVKRRPVLAANEVAIEINIKVPQPPRIIGTIDMELPEPPAMIVDSTVIEYPDDVTVVS